jgi:hypothetical protein
VPKAGQKRFGNESEQALVVLREHLVLGGWPLLNPGLFLEPLFLLKFRRFHGGDHLSRDAFVFGAKLAKSVFAHFQDLRWFVMFSPCAQELRLLYIERTAIGVKKNH